MRVNPLALLLTPVLASSSSGVSGLQQMPSTISHVVVDELLSTVGQKVDRFDQTIKRQIRSVFGESSMWLQEQAIAKTPQGLNRWISSLQSRFAWRRADQLMRGSSVQDLSGSWRLEERHNMDEFLRGLGFSTFQRLAVLRAGQVQVIACGPDTNGKLHIVTRDVRGTSELVLPLGKGTKGPVVEASGDGESKVKRVAFVEDGALVITETIPGEEQPLAECRRFLSEDGRMMVDVKKRTPVGGFVSMRVIFTAVESEQDNNNALSMRARITPPVEESSMKTQQVSSSSITPPAEEAAMKPQQATFSSMTPPAKESSMRRRQAIFLEESSMKTQQVSSSSITPPAEEAAMKPQQAIFSSMTPPAKESSMLRRQAIFRSNTPSAEEAPIQPRHAIFNGAELSVEGRSSQRDIALRVASEVECSEEEVKKVGGWLTTRKDTNMPVIASWFDAPHAAAPCATSPRS